MEKWQLAGIISDGSRQGLIMPSDRLCGIRRLGKQFQGKNRLVTLLQMIFRKTIGVMTVF